VKTRLLDLMCCPGCSGALELTALVVEGAEVLEGVLDCSGCGASFAVERGVPRFVPGDDYAGGFSLQWIAHARTQLDSSTGRHESRDDWDAKCGLDDATLRGATVLDVGCGSGRYAEVALDRGAEVVGIDLSFAVDAAYENLGTRENAHIVQASVFALPFREGAFDSAYSLGVLHHTPSTRDAFRSMLPRVKPGGAVAIWVYWTGMAGRASDAARLLTTRVSDQRLYEWCRRWVPRLRESEASSWLVRRLLTHLPISRSDDMTEAVLETFDWYSPKYQWKHDWAEVEGWFEDEGLVEVVRGQFPVAVRGRTSLGLWAAPQTPRT
jgi:SAM-dependent methyltransferase